MVPNELNNYKLKQTPEDFIVKEVSNFEKHDDGEYSIFLLKKRLISTPRACEIIAKVLNKKVKDIGYSGNKDAHAVTEQLISVKGNAREISNDFFQISFLGKSRKPMTLGLLSGNNFEIIIRNIDMSSKLHSVNFFPNYFDEQRFSENNVKIGTFLLKNDFKGACTLISDFRAKKHLDKHSSDYVGALRTVPRRELLLYVHAVQSLIFNDAVSKYLTDEEHFEVQYSEGKMIFPLDLHEELLKEEVTVPGFDSELPDSKISDLVIFEMKKLGITSRDFIFRQIPGISAEGFSRPMFCEIQNLKVGSLENDELNEGMKKLKISFSLPKGSYATVAVKAMMRK